MPRQTIPEGKFHICMAYSHTAGVTMDIRRSARGEASVSNELEESTKQNDFQTVSPRHDGIHTSSRAAKRGPRSRTGCLTCRARKIKCDERQVSCSNCERIGVSCPGYTLGPLNRSERMQLRSRNSRGITEAGIKRTRLFESCKVCRHAKTKCSGESPACLRCTEKDLPCVYEVGRRRERSRNAMSDGSLSQTETAINGKHDSGMGNPHTVKELTPRDKECGRRNRSTDVEPMHVPAELVPPRGRPLDWLTSPSLPNQERLCQLVEAYFTNVHPLRCFGFIHKPTFMEQLDLGLTSEHHSSAVLYAVCALGARFYALENLDWEDEFAVNLALSAGNGWASKAQSLLSSDLSQITIERLMAAVLLHDYQLRVGNYLAAFMLSGITARMVQALQINLEFSTDILCFRSIPPIDATMRESRRRLMWSCFAMDSWVGSGVDQLTLLDERDIRVQLPCNERCFLQQIPCITETMANGQVLSFLHKESVPANPAANMGLIAYFIRISELRKKVLRFVKAVDISQSTQLPDAEFAALDAAFEQWLNSLPSTLHLNSKTIYIRKESNQLAALFLLHIVYHVSICDLYRVGNPRLLPSLMRHRFPAESSTQHEQFLARCRKTCFEHAKEVATILDRAIQHGRATLSDTWLPTVAYESTRIMLYQITLENKGIEVSQDVLGDVLPHFKANMKALRLMIPLFAAAKDCYQAATCLLRKMGLDPQLVEGTSYKDESSYGIIIEGPSIRNANSHITPESVLNPLAIYSLARKDLCEKHTPEEVPATPSEATTSDWRPIYIETSPAITQSVYMRNQDFQQTSSAPVLPQCNELSFSAPTDSTSGISVNQSTPEQWSAAAAMPLEFGNFALDFMPHFGESWRPVETVQEGIVTRGIPSWAASSTNEIIDDIFGRMPNFSVYRNGV